MIVHLYAACWNEARVLEFFFRHYDPIVERFVIYDDGSTDESLEILRRHPRVDVRRLDRLFSDSLVLSLRSLYNECWKESRGVVDWVIVTNVDEHIYHPRLKDYLYQCKRAGITMIPALGYEMISDRFPRPGETLTETVTCGAPRANMSKLAVFDPNAIVETGYCVGRHKAYPKGDLQLPARDELMNLHYKQLSLEYVVSRYKEQQARLLAEDVRMRLGYHYGWGEAAVAKDRRAIASRAVDVTAADFEPWKVHSERRWWRPRPGRPVRKVFHTLARFFGTAVAR